MKLSVAHAALLSKRLSGEICVAEAERLADDAS